MAVLENNSKCAFQKLYEKWQMACHAEGQIRVMAAKRMDGRLELFLAVGDTPIAKLMTHQELQLFTPDFENSATVSLIFAKMRRIDPRSDGEWDETVGNGFEDEFLQRVDEISEL